MKKNHLCLYLVVLLAACGSESQNNKSTRSFSEAPCTSETAHTMTTNLTINEKEEAVLLTNDGRYSLSVINADLNICVMGSVKNLVVTSTNSNIYISNDALNIVAIGGTGNSVYIYGSAKMIYLDGTGNTVYSDEIEILDNRGTNTKAKRIH